MTSLGRRPRAHSTTRLATSPKVVLTSDEAGQDPSAAGRPRGVRSLAFVWSDSAQGASPAGIRGDSHDAHRRVHYRHHRGPDNEKPDAGPPRWSSRRGSSFWPTSRGTSPPGGPSACRAPSRISRRLSATGSFEVVILLPALGIAAQLGRSGSSLRLGGSDSPARRAAIASALGLAVSVLVILLGFVWFRQEGGTVFAGHHSSEGSPPLIGTAGLIVSYVTCAGLGLMALRRRRTAKAAQRTRQRRKKRQPAPVGANRFRVHNVSTVRGGWQ